MDSDRPAFGSEQQLTAGREGLNLRTRFFVLDWTVKFSRLTATLDGQPREVAWGRHFFPLQPGRH
jgi:hypothetical protein